MHVKATPAIGPGMTRPPFTMYTSNLLKREPEAFLLEPLNEKEIRMLADRLHKKVRKSLAAACLCLFFASPAFAAIDLNLLAEKIVAAESSGNPRAIGDGGKSRGLMQIQEPTWKRHTSLSFDKAFDPELNKRVGTAILEGIVKEYRRRGVEPSAAYVVWTYNTGSFVKRSLPKLNKQGKPHPWTINHPNLVYRSIYQDYFRGHQ